MTELLGWAVAGLSVVLGLLVASILIQRFRSDRRRAREEALRPEVEAGLVEYLVSDDPEPPSDPALETSREILFDIAMEGLTELRGRERERLVALLESRGFVADIAADLGARRRRTRKLAADTLGHIGSRQATGPLVAGLADGDRSVRVACAAALAQLGADEHAEQIIEVAGEAAASHPGTAATVLLTLGRRSPAVLGQPVSAAAPAELRRLAVVVIGELRLAGHVEALREALASSDDELVARAARGLGRIGDAEAVGPLLALMSESDAHAPFVRLAAVEALGALGDPRAAPALEEQLLSGDWLARSKSAAALAQLGPAGGEALQRARSSPLEDISGHARVALER